MSDIVVIAENPNEMKQSQADLSAWAERRVGQCERDIKSHERIVKQLEDVRMNARDAKHHLRLAIRKLDYYRKIEEAIAAGFTIIPDMPCDVVAVRTEGVAVSDDWTEESIWGKPRRSAFELPTERLTHGKGRYVSANPKVSYRKESRTTKDGKTEIVHVGQAHALDEAVALPVQFRRPQLISATNAAMALKVFDDIAVVGARNRDPMVIGRVKHWQHQYDYLSFLIAWFIDTSTI